MHEPLPLHISSAANIASAPHVLHRDYETRGKLLLKSVGTHRYAADSSTDVLCCAYAIDDGPIELWIPGEPLPPEFLEVAHNSSWLVAAHGDHFECAIERHIMAPRFGWPEIPLERHRCTMSMSLVAGLPARLSAAADAGWNSLTARTQPVSG